MIPADHIHFHAQVDLTSFARLEEFSDKIQKTAIVERVYVRLGRAMFDNELLIVDTPYWLDDSPEGGSIIRKKEHHCSIFVHDTLHLAYNHIQVIHMLYEMGANYRIESLVSNR